MRWLASIFMIFFMGVAFADTLTVTPRATNATKEALGTITFEDTRYGLLMHLNLGGLPSGAHGIHLHTNPSCAGDGSAAGGHWDPKNTDKHRGPFDNSGHLGDLPVIYADYDGLVHSDILAPRLKVADLYGHSLIIHAGGDNYLDEPIANGGGGDRIACVVISKPKAAQ